MHRMHGNVREGVQSTLLGRAWFCDKHRVHVFAISQDTTGEHVEVACMFQKILDKMSSLKTKQSNKADNEVVPEIQEKLMCTSATVRDTYARP